MDEIKKINYKENSLLINTIHDQNDLLSNKF